VLWQGKIKDAFWKTTGILSLTVNVVLIVVLVLLAQELFTLKTLVNDQLLGGLRENFEKMDAAVIETTVVVEDNIVVNDTILVDDTIPVVFDLPLNKKTTVKLSEDTFIQGATVNLTSGGLTLQNADADIILPRGTELPIRLSLTVPVSQTLPVQLVVPINLSVPVSLSVPVEIPLAETQLHEPFVGLQGVVAPYNDLLLGLPNSWDEMACDSGPALCALQRFLKRVFTPRELAAFGDQPASLAARWAAKEAVAKAFGTGIGDISFQEIEVLHGDRKEPVLHLHGAAAALADTLGLSGWSVSLSHTETHAAAVAVAIGE
jgi:holo-[acyl-carrier protein] synthase